MQIVEIIKKALEKIANMNAREHEHEYFHHDETCITCKEMIEIAKKTLKEVKNV